MQNRGRKNERIHTDVLGNGITGKSDCSCTGCIRVYCKSKREEEKKKGIIRTKYRVKTEKIIIIICVVGAIFFSTCMTICIIEREALWVIGVCGIMALFGVFGTLNTMMWRLEINGDEITWRSTFGRKRRFLFKDITYCERKKGSVRVYVNGKKLFTIDNNEGVKFSVSMGKILL